MEKGNRASRGEEIENEEKGYLWRNDSKGYGRKIKIKG